MAYVTPDQFYDPAPVPRPPSMLADAWRSIRELARGFRVASVATVSVLIGLLMYRYVDQVHDLFLEDNDNKLRAALFWATFYVAVIAAWAVPVYLSARYVIARYNTLAEADHRDDLVPVEPWVASLVPPLLGTLCVLAVLIGQWEAMTSSPLAPRSGCRLDEMVQCISAALKEAYPGFDNFKMSRSGFSSMFGDQKAVDQAKAAVEHHLNWGANFNVIPGLIALLATGLAILMVPTAIRAALDRQPTMRNFGHNVRWFYLGVAAVAAGLAVLIVAAFAQVPAAQQVLPALLAVPKAIFNVFFPPDVAHMAGVIASLSRPGEHVAMAARISDHIFAALGQKAVVVMLLLLLASPLAFYLLARLLGVLDGIHHQWLRWQAKALAWCAIVNMAVFSLYAALILFLWSGRIAKLMADPVSLIGMPLQLAVTAIAAMIVWKLLRRHAEEPVELGAFGQAPRFYSGLLAASVAGIAIVLFANPLWISDVIARAPLFPIILGIWVPALTLLTAVSYLHRVPYIIAAMALIGILTIPFGDPHDIRTVGAGQPREKRPLRPAIEDVAKQWAAANHCDLPSRFSADAPVARPCPSPIIVLAVGGASRSAFKVASVLGDLMDWPSGLATDKDGRSYRRQGAEAAQFRRQTAAFDTRLFAISAVSGGALAAVTLQAALADAITARDDPNMLAPPCRKGAVDSLWYGQYLLTNNKGGLADPTLSWRSCLQLILAGDFLSPSAIPLLGSDVLQIGLHGDRAAVLERAWERRYQRIVGKRTLEEPLVGLRNGIVDAKRGWLPVLLLNGTSVATGRRIITTDVEFIDRHGLLFTDASDLHHLFTSGKPQGVPREEAEAALRSGCETCDVRLSTAATMSARFPVVSPHGTIRDAAGKVADRVVDGGYFENYGAVTAHEVGNLLWTWWRLKPTYILITNDPDTPTIDRLDDGNQGALNCSWWDGAEKRPPTSEHTTLSIASSPLKAVMGTRSARGTLAAVSLCKDALLRGGRLEHFVQFGVAPEKDIFGATQLSMSWWLSKFVQRKLNEVGPGDQQRIEAVWKSLHIGPAK